jgi:hypothetical protein
MVRRQRCIALLLPATLILALSGAARAADPNKILHVALSDIDTLDPQRLTDAYSGLVAGAIFEGLWEWDYLVRPRKLVRPTRPNEPAGPAPLPALWLITVWKQHRRGIFEIPIPA